MRVLSLYCGAGGIDEGLKQAGIKTTLAIDVDRDCCQTMKLNHDCEILNGEVADYEKSLDDFDIVVGGPPCQDFSPANPKRTFDLTEVYRFWNIILKLKPKYYLMENVPLLATKFKPIKTIRINCADYGTPQKRIRNFWTNIPKPNKQKWKGVNEFLNIDGHISPTGFKNCNQYIISTPVNEPCKTILVANKYLLTDNPVYSKKYAYLKDVSTVLRAITNEELAIIQGFPKTYRFSGSKSSVKRQI